MQVEPLRAVAPPGARFVLVTATLPEAVYQALAPLFPGLVPVLGPGAPSSACPPDSQSALASKTSRRA